MCDDHISLYQLTLERGTELFKLVQNKKLVRDLCVLPREVANELAACMHLGKIALCVGRGHFLVQG